MEIQTIPVPPMLDMRPLRACPPRPAPRVRPNRRRLQAVLARLAALNSEALALVRPLPHAEPFHASRKKVAIGDGSNQAGKSMAFAVEVARALGNGDPHNKYPKGGLAIFVGYDEDHLADPIYKKLFKPGEFKLIRDERTGLLRSVRPDPDDPLRLDPYDLAYREKWIDAPPLVPPRLIRRMAWEDSAKEIPRVTELTTGWRILWRASGGKPPQGVQAALIWADEEIRHSNLWVNELIPRLIKTGGRFLWSATPREGGPELYELRLKADEGSPYVDRFTFLIDQNPFMTPEEKEAFRSLLTSDEEIAVRYYGEYAIAGRRVYPTYDPNGIHGCEPFEVPPDWCRYAIVDPSTALCATLLVAVDPDEAHLWVYDSFVLHKAEATEWAYALQERERGVQFQGIVMDQRAGNQKSFNAAETTSQRFARALETVGMTVRARGAMNGFIPGSADLKARTMALREAMVPRAEGPFAGTPLLQVMRGVCPELDRQIKNANSDARDPEKRKKFDGQTCDLLDDLEYAAAADLRYYEPVRVEETVVSYAVRDFREQERRRNRIAPRQRMVVG